MHGVDLEDEGGTASGGGGVGLQPSVGSDPTQGKGTSAWQQALALGRAVNDAKRRQN